MLTDKLQEIDDRVMVTNENRRARNEHARYHPRSIQMEEDLTEDVKPMFAKEFPSFSANTASTSRGTCLRKDTMAKTQGGTDVEGMQEIYEQVANGEITTAAEFAYSLGNYVSDCGALFREILDKDLNFFREIVDDTIDQRVQDEADVMMHTQNDIKQKFQSLTDAMIHRTMRIKQRLFEISSKFDWAANGKNRTKIENLITVKRKEISGDPRMIDKLIHQVFMRSQWLKKELNRLQEENANLKMFLNKFRILAAERKAQESHVPRMLGREKKILEREFDCLQRIYRRNLEVIDTLYIEYHRCTKAPSETSTE